MSRIDLLENIQVLQDDWKIRKDNTPDFFSYPKYTIP